MTVTVDNVGAVWADGERIGTVTADGIEALRGALAGQPPTTAEVLAHIEADGVVDRAKWTEISPFDWATLRTADPTVLHPDLRLV